MKILQILAHPDYNNKNRISNLLAELGKEELRKRYSNITTLNLYDPKCYIPVMDKHMFNYDGKELTKQEEAMLDVLVKNNIKNVCATVIRYYGGTKLGTGGLVRAYGGGVINALKNATLVERKDAFEIKLEIDYSLNGKIEYEIDKTNFIVNNIDYTDKLVYTIYVMQEDYSNFETWIANLTNGQFKIISSREKQLEFDIQ